MKINGATQTITPQSPAKITGGTTVSKGTDGSYTINLSDKNNKVDVSQNANGSWNISIDGKARLTLSEKEMANLTINGNGGNDTITVSKGDLKQPITIDGGAGNDKVSLGFDLKARTFVDKERVNFKPGQGGAQRDTFEYTVRSSVTAGVGEALPSSTFSRRTETHE